MNEPQDLLFTKEELLMREIDHQMHLAGYHNEREVLHLILQIAEKSQWEWFVDARISTNIEDAHGIDIVIETSDVGKLFFQVKSSHTGALKFQKRRHGAHIAIIIASCHDSQPELSKKIAGIILNERRSIIALREGKG